jgi:putative endonuclease
MFYTYILRNQQGFYYIGQTNNLDERIKRHQKGRSGFTKNRGPWELVYFEEYPTRALAVQREREIKKKKSVVYIENLVSKQSG